MQRMRNCLCGLLLLFVQFGCYALDTQKTARLQVALVNTAHVLYEWPVSPGTEFYLDYIHSSAKTPVQDIFTISEQGGIILIEENFSWFGAGLEAGTSDAARVIYDPAQKKIRVLQHRHLARFLLRIGRVAQQRMTCNGKSISLNSLAKAGESVHIRVVPTVVLP